MCVYWNSKNCINMSTGYKTLLSIVIPVLNDNEEANLTIESIRATSPNDVEIIVVDDCSDTPVKLTDPHVKLTRREQRMGAGNSKHLGVELANSKHVLLIDSHMRFANDWYEQAMKLLPDSPKTLWCAICIGLNKDCMDMAHPRGAYYGANLVLYDDKKRIFQGVWTKKMPGENYEISCAMGACYFVNRDWFLRIGGTKSHKMWGSLEPFISIKYWLSGGEVRLMSNVKIGHKFRNEAPYSTEIKYIEYNKIRPMKTILPDEMYKLLLSKIPDDVNKVSALQIIEKEKGDIESEQEHYRKIFVHDIYWFLKKFGISNPCEQVGG